MSSSEWLASGPDSDSWIPNAGFGPVDGGDDLRLIGQTGANALVHAERDVALNVARHVASEIPGGCARILVFDCDAIPAAQAQRLLDQYLRRGSRTLIETGILLIRECHELSNETQSALIDLLAQRRRAEPCARILASTSVPLYDRVRTRRFHPVLFYLLNTVTLNGDVLDGRRTRLSTTARPLLIRYASEGQGS